MGSGQGDSMDKTDILIGVVTRMDEKIDRVLEAKENHEQRIKQLEARPNVESFSFWKAAGGVVVAGLIVAAVIRLTMPEPAAKAIVDKIQVSP